MREVKHYAAKGNNAQRAELVQKKEYFYSAAFLTSLHP
jgi:hypothetical protein